MGLPVQGLPVRLPISALFHRMHSCRCGAPTWCGALLQATARRSGEKHPLVADCR